MNSIVSQIELSRREKLKAYYELMKPRLSFLVVFSSGFGYLLATPLSENWLSFIVFLIGGFLVSGSSVTINQIVEKEFDAVMKRTKNRPIPTRRISSEEASFFSIISGLAGAYLIYYFTTPLAAWLSILSLILYAFIYTPLKRIGSIAVFVGAIPGALPPLIGWTAASGVISYESMVIFSIQFVWQFPHFWAIAWISDEDYKKAGFKLLPGGGGKDLNTAINIMIYTLFLLPLGLLPTLFGLTGLTSALIATTCGILFLATTFSLMKDTTNERAKTIMFSSFIYLPIVQITFLMDKL
ncbi:MAG: heme o synthase [Bacteroidota bacterium]